MRARRVVLLLGVNLGFLVLFLLLALAGLEAYYRMTTPAPQADRIGTLRRDRQLGWDSIPEVEVLAEARAGAPAVVFAGDSFTQNAGWTRQTIALARAAGKDLRGYSLGVAGYGTVQSLVKLERLFDTYRPAVVAHLFFAWNDIRDNFNHPGIYYNRQTRSRPYFSFSGGGGKITTPFMWPDFVLSLMVYERFVLRPESAAMARAMSTYGIDWVTEHKLPFLLGYADPASWMPFYRRGTQEAAYVREAWHATEAAFAEMKAFVDAKGARLVVLGIDNAFTVDADVRSQWIEGQDADVALPLTRLGLVLGRLGVPYVNCLGPLQELASSLGRKVYNGPAGNLSGHLEPEGENLVAELATRAILEQLSAGGVR